MTRSAKDEAKSNDLALTVVKRVIRRIQREGRPLTVEVVCQEIEDYKSMPTLADKVTTAMVRQALMTFM